jgi:phosphatidylglycerophosphate synthase
MISHWVRTWITRVFRPIAQVLAKAGISANMLTVANVVMAVLTGVLIGYQRLLWAALALVISGLCDSLDGELARLAGQATRTGAFIDSISDHYGDFAIYLGLLSLFISRDSTIGIMLVFFAMVGSLIGSQIRSRAGMVGIELRTIGIFTRMERTLVILIGLVTGQVLIASALLALANNFSALQRLLFTLRAAKD